MGDFDRLPESFLDPFHYHLIQHYKHLFLCKSCIRSFRTKDVIEKCRFCGSDHVKEIGHGHTKNVLRSPLIRGFCIKCDESFYTTEHTELCKKCGSKFIHLYPADRIEKPDMILIYIEKAKRYIISFLYPPTNKSAVY